MKWTIPGTQLQIQREEAENIQTIFSAMFLAGGMVLSQVSNLTGLEPYTVQNWVKRGLLSPPVRKRYSLRQLCRIVNINMLKGVLPMERICGMLSYINGQLDDESDDIIDDFDLYLYFIEAISKLQKPVADEEYIAKHIEAVISDFKEPFPGAKRRLQKVLAVMLNAYLSATLRKRADEILSTLD